LALTSLLARSNPTKAKTVSATVALLTSPAGDQIKARCSGVLEVPEEEGSTHTDENRTRIMRGLLRIRFGREVDPAQ